MSQACSTSLGKIYGLQRVCRVWGFPRSTIYEQRRKRTDPRPASRRGPQGPCSDEELVKHIRTVLLESPFHGEGYRKVWARLRFKGIRTSKERARRLMREYGLQAPQRMGNRHGPKAHDGTINTSQPDEILGYRHDHDSNYQAGHSSGICGCGPLYQRVCGNPRL